MIDGRPTEAAEARFAEIDLLPTRELVALINDEDATVAAAVAAAGDALAEAIDAVAARLARGGRLVYAGAGTSGRIAEIDASELAATFGSPPGEVAALVADDEDDAAAGAAAVRGLGVSRDDAVVGVSASGSTAYVVGALEAAREAGALLVAVVCAHGSRLGALAAHEVAVVVGPEVIAGSTRLKAGTAQKLVLNTLSTAVMVRLGRTYGGLMVGVAPDNAKLRARARRNIAVATGADDAAIEAALADAGGDARVALVSLLAGIGAAAARERLAGAGGSVRGALGSRT